MRLQHTTASRDEEERVLLMGTTSLPIVVIGAGPVGLALPALRRPCESAAGDGAGGL